MFSCFCVSLISLYTCTLWPFASSYPPSTYSLPFLNCPQTFGNKFCTVSRFSCSVSELPPLCRDAITSVPFYTKVLHNFHSILESCFPQNSLVGFVIAAFHSVACLCWGSWHRWVSLSSWQTWGQFLIYFG